MVPYQLTRDNIRHHREIWFLLDIFEIEYKFDPEDIDGGAEVTYIGDSPYDKACAITAGAKFILAPWGSSQPVEVEDQFRASSPEDILNLI